MLDTEDTALLALPMVMVAMLGLAPTLLPILEPSTLQRGPLNRKPTRNMQLVTLDLGDMVLDLGATLPLGTLCLLTPLWVTLVTPGAMGFTMATEAIVDSTQEHTMAKKNSSHSIQFYNEVELTYYLQEQNFGLNHSLMINIWLGLVT